MSFTRAIIEKLCQGDSAKGIVRGLEEKNSEKSKKST
jgi:hypothetical protein